MTHPAATRSSRRRLLLPRGSALLLLGAVLLALGCTERGDRGAGAAQRKRQPVTAAAPRSSVTPGFVAIPAGSFTMGSPADEVSRYTNEQQHRVTLTRAYELAATEVTQAEFRAVMGYDPSRFAGCPRCPVENVSWHEAAAYCNALSERRRLARCYRCSGSGPAVSCAPAPEHAGAAIYRCPGYRLPTDAEWEHAYRAGSATPYPNGSNDPQLRATCSGTDPIADALGWYCQNAGQRTHEVGLKHSSRFGLHDMGGNVWEWCHDQYLAILSRDAVDPWGIDGSPMRVARGGSWKYYSRGMRSACRAWYAPSYRGDGHGLRPARTL